MLDIKLSLILPTYNEEGNIKIFLPRLFRLFVGEVFEIVLVDDGSSDGTVAVARELTDKNSIPLELVLRSGKQGIGSAICAGYNAAHGAILFSMDADCAFSDHDIMAVWKKFNSEQLDLLVGQRIGGSYESASLRTWLKKQFSVLGNGLVSALVGLKGVNDFSLNFRIIKQPIWRQIADRPYHPRNFFLFQMVDQVRQRAGRIGQIPVQFLDRKLGVSKMNIMRDPFIFFYNFLLWKIRQ